MTDRGNQEHNNFISYRSPIAANLLSKFSNFVIMATGVSLKQISLTQLNSLTPKPPIGATIGAGVSSVQAELQQILCLVTTVGYHGNRGWFGVSLNDTIKLADTGSNSLYVSSTMPKL